VDGVVGSMLSQAPGTETAYALNDGGRPTLRQSGGLSYFELTSPGGISWDIAGSAAYTIAMAINTGDTSAVLISDNTAGNGLNMGSGNASPAVIGTVGSPTLEINGVATAFTTRDDLYDAVSGGLKVVIINGLDFTSASAVGIGRQGLSSASLLGNVYRFLAYPDGTITNALARAWLNQGAGL